MNQSYNYFIPFQGSDEVMGIRVIDVETEEEGQEVLLKFLADRAAAAKAGEDKDKVPGDKPILIARAQGELGDLVGYKLLALLSEAEMAFWKGCIDRSTGQPTTYDPDKCTYVESKQGLES